MHTNDIAVKIHSGTETQINATVRHGKNAPKKYVMNCPMQAKSPAEANIIPRIDVSLSIQKFDPKKLR